MGTYRKVIRDTVQVRSKYKEMSCGDCRTSKHDFRALEKLTHRPSDGIEPRAKRADVSGPLAVGGQGIISVKHTLARVVKGWLTYREVIRNDQSMGKSHVVIAGSVKNDFGSWKI
ncbi:hypothetical protein YC2023_032067 [Brassica napus]